MTDTRFVHGAERVRRRIQSIQRATQVALHSGLLENLLLQRIKERFRRGVDADGKPWPALKDTTTKRKSYQYDGKGPLFRTGDLFRAIQIIQGTNEGSFAVSTGAGFRIGISGDNEDIAEYARAQNYGFFHYRSLKRVPARRFLGIGELDRKAVDSLLRRVIIKQGLGA